MPKPMTRRHTLEIQAGADALLAPGGGGIAIWVRRDELQPRAAVRFSTAVKAGEQIDHIKIATILATLQIGLERVRDGLADNMNMPREQLEAQVSAAVAVLRPMSEATTNIIRDGNKERA